MYVAKLKMVCARKTIEINVVQPNHTSQLWFGNFYFCIDEGKNDFIGAFWPFIRVYGCYLKNKYGRGTIYNSCGWEFQWTIISNGLLNYLNKGKWKLKMISIVVNLECLET